MLVLFVVDGWLVQNVWRKLSVLYNNIRRCEDAPMIVFERNASCDLMMIHIMFISIYTHV